MRAPTADRSLRGRGYGSELIHLAIEWARDQGLEWIQLQVFGHNRPARRLYAKAGFVEVGLVPDMFRVNGQKIDDITMILDLRRTGT